MRGLACAEGLTLPASHPFTPLLKCPLFLPGPVLVPRSPRKLATLRDESWDSWKPQDFQGGQGRGLQREVQPLGGALRTPLGATRNLRTLYVFMLVFAHVNCLTPAFPNVNQG